MALYPFPNVPPYPGVPPLTRALTVAVTATPALALGIGALENVLASAYQQPTQWGIYDTEGNQLGDSSDGVGINSIINSILAQGSVQLSTVSFNYSKETRISDYPVEEGSFASYNKVQIPVNPVVTMALDGTVSDRTTFLNTLETACNSTQLFNIVTPEITYVGYSIERISYDRSAVRGATLLTVDVTLKEIRQVSAAFSQVTTSQIVNPVNPAATPTVNNGKVQPGGNTSTLKSIAQGLGIVQ